MTGLWIDVCNLDDIIPDTGVCALIEGKQVAIFRVGGGDTVYGLSNFDPFSQAFVLSRGIVGDAGGIPKVASPIYKDSFNLRTGRCLDKPHVHVRTYQAQVRQGRVELSLAPSQTSQEANAGESAGLAA
jgi:nitrite reductase (NADH) small subunit